jgi:polar amino acid transport system substrate-binding protein
MRWFINIFLVFSAPTILNFVSCDDFPRDQTGTYERIRKSGEMRIGLVESPPYVIKTGGEPAGVEVELLERFAEANGAKPTWQWGGEERLLAGLEHFEMDAVAAGITDSTPWTKRVGLTSPYHKHQVIAIPPGENQLLKRLDEFLGENRDEIAVKLEHGGNPNGQ